MKENKIWGETSLIWSGNNTEVHRIIAISGGYCSKHYHKSKYNMFYIESGSLLIEVWNDSGIVDKTIIKSGESTSVAPGVYHRFTALEDTEALEIYYVKLDSIDIVRETIGGILI